MEKNKSQNADSKSINITSKKTKSNKTYKLEFYLTIVALIISTFFNYQIWVGANEANFLSKQALEEARNANALAKESNQLAIESNEISRFNLNNAQIKLQYLDEHLLKENEKLTNKKCDYIQNSSLATDSRNNATKILINGNLTPEEIIAFNNEVRNAFDSGTCVRIDSSEAPAMLISPTPIRFIIIILTIAILYFIRSKDKN